MSANSQESSRDQDMNHQTFSVGSCDEAVRAALDDLQAKDFVRRLWAKDPALWHEDPAHQAIIRNALGWLTVSEQQIRYVRQLQAFANEVKTAGFTHVLLMGMGGSSLCPEVFRMTFGVMAGYPELHVLDSTVPSQVKSFEERIDLERTLCIVASKSGSTTEPLVFQKYFFERMQRIRGDRVGEHFVAITDPGSQLEGLARELRFRAIFPGMPDIGGRYSALSNFGMVPAAAMGVDVEALLQRAERIRQQCGANVPAPDNPGVTLGTVLGTLARAGRDKVTFIASPAISDLGAWLEQLIAESTGKEEKGLIPVDDEPVGEAHVYGNDRVFVYIRYADGAVPEQDTIVDALKSEGHPVVRIDCTSVLNLGQEFFRWEVATATAGSLLGVNAFDQPNVQESKDFTKFYLEEFKKNGRLPEESSVFTDGDVRLFTDDANHQALKGASSLVQAMAAHLSRVRTGDYVAINAYLERTPAVHEALQRIRALIRDKRRVATTLGYGPRFLHSTGQLHKGGPNSGVFLQITADHGKDPDIPDEPYSFGTLVAAQALGDMKSLCTRNRRVIRVHLSRNVEAGLSRLQKTVEDALSFAPPL
ncbi:MAG: bifunctional transaldolase/phosoglucose isomerase [Nitrospira sp. SB0675_bin_23]|nr:bifunctional transaldolase/phosoglucose isomerase [Nitrospira sp. SB0675_bin_23]